MVGNEYMDIPNFNFLPPLLSNISCEMFTYLHKINHVLNKSVISNYYVLCFLTA